ncbi:ABC transporter substrate-binding protein [Tessaracoccus rhinocerotis]|uniref:ABC transporter substrate-binding protein n=1 Tax=Tessaracoccus rhinocerotis TaxID=1689449 RepID=A0A553K5G3_9ACTN|nr:ABC transporter substrate-binding protein [Tessaracoccus rhinocerotis]TRY19940.1 ABC transporter substrate-binding protein [Tessaracoccus rhinocerotis]
MRLRPIIAAAATAALALTACSTPTDETTTPAESTDRTHDVSGVEKVDEIASLLPADVADSGKLVVGASIDYAPAEFRAEDLQTAIGYDIDLSRALGNVLGLEAEIAAAEFDSLLPGIGTKYDVGISSFTITEERTANYNMISYIEVGSSYAVKAGNPTDFDPENVCGTTIGVQTGTYQEEELVTFNEACTEAGEEAIEVLPYASQSDVTTNVIGGKADAFYADSTVAHYAVELTGGQMEVVGGIRDSAPQGIVVNQDDPELTEAMHAAMQHLMDDGTWEAILTSWGNEDAIITTAEVHP